MARNFAVQVSSSGTTKNLEQFLKMAGKSESIRSRIESVAQEGVAALRAATPVRSGFTAASWSYKIIESGDGLSIEFHNSSQNRGYHIAVLLRYGHGTRNGGYVPPNDFITPALRPIFDRIATEAWKAVTSNA